MSEPLLNNPRAQDHLTAEAIVRCAESEAAAKEAEAKENGKMLPANRPQSWNAKMLMSGEPLITDEQFEKLLANAPTSVEATQRHDPVPVVKIFLPHVRWILGWINPNDLNRAFGIMKWGNRKPEAGEFLAPTL